MATLGSSGMRLYVDGVLRASNANTVAEPFTGYVRFGGGTLANWPSAPSDGYFSGQLAFGAVYPTALSASKVADHYDAGT